MALQVDYELAPGSLRSAKEIFPASLVRVCRCVDTGGSSGWAAAAAAKQWQQPAASGKVHHRSINSRRVANCR